MTISWGSGFKRLSRGFLLACWAVFLAIHVADGRAAIFGENLVYMLVFTVGYMLFCMLVAWIARGFSQSRG